MKIYLFELFTPSGAAKDLLLGKSLCWINLGEEDRKHLNKDKDYLLRLFERLGINKDDIIALYTDHNHPTTLKGNDGTCYAFFDAVAEYTGKECPVVRIDPTDKSDDAPSQIAGRQKLSPAQFVTYAKIQNLMAVAREDTLLKLFTDASQKKDTNYSDQSTSSSDFNSTTSPNAGYRATSVRSETLRPGDRASPVTRSVKDAANSYPPKYLIFLGIALMVAFWAMSARIVRSEVSKLQEESRNDELQKKDATIRDVMTRNSLLEQSLSRVTAEKDHCRKSFAEYMNGPPSTQPHSVIKDDTPITLTY